jgi:hypothetical protein
VDNQTPIAQTPVLTLVERLLLANQFAVLERLYPSKQREYASKRDIVERGVVDDYDALFCLGEPNPRAKRGESSQRKDWDRLEDSLDRGGALTPW